MARLTYSAFLPRFQSAAAAASPFGVVRGRSSHAAPPPAPLRVALARIESSSGASGLQARRGEETSGTRV